MTLAGCSRPCSGPEHLISHAFDFLGVGTGTHGERVGVGSVLAAQLSERGLSPVELLQRIGARLRPVEIGIDDQDVLRAMKWSTACGRGARLACRRRSPIQNSCTSSRGLPGFSGTIGRRLGRLHERGA
jgi:glycerol dehydrogenase-like iron-containing ADH family enzyme